MTSDDGGELRLLRAAHYAAVEPWALLQAVHGPDGRIIDFVYRDVNPAGAAHQQRRREELIGHSVAEILPEVARVGLIARYAHCVETGEPLILDDYSYTGQTVNSDGVELRRYEVRGVRADADHLSLTWRDVNHRYLTQRQIAESEERYRLLAENSWDVVAHVRGGVLVWVSQSAETPSGARAEHWIGRPVRDLIPAEDWPVLDEMMDEISAGTVARRRLRLFDAYGVTHWVELRAKAFHDAAGNHDGETISLRVIDAEVATERDLEEARRRQAASDALYRQSMDSAAVGMALTRTDGAFIDVNRALCEFLGYDAETLMTKTWTDVTAPAYIQSDLSNVEDLVAGRIQSYRTIKQYVHADGHLIWGDLSVGCVREAGGGTVTLVAQVVDITEEMRAREQLDEARSELSEALRQSEHSRALMRVASDALLDPQALLEAQRDSSGRIIDFVYREINQATSDYLGLAPADLLGRGVVETMPGLEEKLLPGYIRCLETGEPLVLNDFSYDNEVLRDTRRYDIRVTRATAESVVLTWRDVTDRFLAAQDLAQANELLRASADSMLDPQVLYETVRDAQGKVVDFRFLAINRATTQYLQVSEGDLVGKNVLEVFPNMVGSGLMERYTRCLEDGQPVILTDFGYFNDLLEDARRYDIRATKAGPDRLSLTWSDVTERYRAAQRLAASEEQYRLLAMNATDVIVHIRDGVVVWVSPSVQGLLGAPPEYWIGRETREVVPQEDLAEFERRGSIVASGGSLQERIRVTAVDGVTHWVHLRAAPFYDADGLSDGGTAALRLIDAEVAAEQQADEARRARARADELYRRSVDSAAVGMCLADVDGHLTDVNGALCRFFGYDAETLQTKTWQELTAQDYLQADLEKRDEVLAGEIESYHMVKRFVHADGRLLWGDLSVGCVRGADGRVETFIKQIIDVTADREAREQLEQARHREAVANALYRRSVDNAAIGMCLIDPEGRFVDVNPALCHFFGYDAETLTTKTWQQLTAPAYLDADLGKVEDVLNGHLDSYRMLKQYIHADGRLIWGDLSVSCIRDQAGRVEQFVSQIIDVTATVEANELNIALNQRLTDELRSAATYIASIMPSGLFGEVTVTSRYLPSRELGGDCFDYSWIDDDHLIVYLIDVSGHGIEPALLAVSVQNMLRSGTFPADTLLDPTAVLTELNRLFQMDQQSDHFFTIWYGVYDRRTRTLRYASAAAPPAYAFTAEERSAATELNTRAAPVGAFEDTRFSTAEYTVPPGCRILIYSDGASEILLADGHQLSHEGFRTIVTRIAAAADWTLDDLVDQLRDITANGVFQDDLSLIRLAFD